jgi:TetR/AcrR family transcriptional regulator, transcriptional repressor for nem operon
MPRVSRAQTQRNDAAIRRAAAALLRRQGLNVSVAQVMAAAGLTPGGFYGHFGSKDELLASGCAAAFAESAQRWEARAAAAPDAAVPAALIEAYLDPEGPVASGCPIASLAADVAREPADQPVGRAFAAGLERLLGILAAGQPGSGDAGREAALLQLSAMVGAVTLARATRGSPLAGELLEGVRRGLRAPPRPRPGAHAARARRGQVR